MILLCQRAEPRLDARRDGRHGHRQRRDHGHPRDRRCAAAAGEVFPGRPLLGGLGHDLHAGEGVVEIVAVGDLRRGDAEPPIQPDVQSSASVGWSVQSCPSQARSPETSNTPTRWEPSAFSLSLVSRSGDRSCRAPLLCSVICYQFQRHGWLRIWTPYRSCVPPALLRLASQAPGSNLSSRKTRHLPGILAPASGPAATGPGPEHKRAGPEAQCH